MEEKRPSTLERLREEITVLRIEGTLFCFDPKEAKRRRRHHHQHAQGC